MWVIIWYSPNAIHIQGLDMDSVSFLVHMSDMDKKFVQLTDMTQNSYHGTHPTKSMLPVSDTVHTW